MMTLVPSVLLLTAIHLPLSHSFSSGWRKPKLRSCVSSTISVSPTRLAYRQINGANNIVGIDVDEVVDPEFAVILSNKGRPHPFDDNYDNDFDVNAFEKIRQYSCVVEYDTETGVAQPFVSNMESESTFVNYRSSNDVCGPAGPIGQLKEQVANYLRRPSVEVTIAFSVLINCALVAVSTIDMATPIESQLVMAEASISAIFAVDFLGRWFSSSKDFGRHVFKPQFALDVLVVVFPLLFGLFSSLPTKVVDTTVWLPAWMTSPSALINLELLRVLRLRRVLESKESFQRFERALGLTTNIKDWQLQLARVLLSLFTLLSVSAGMIYTAEHGVNPQITDYFTALYFGLCTLSTVGFGDITPITWQGKLVVGGSIVAGVAIVPPQAAALVEALLARQEEKDYRITRQSGRPRRRQQLRPPNDIGSSMSSASINGNSNLHRDTDGRMVLETAFECPHCGSTMHWSTARFCWSCGEELP